MEVSPAGSKRWFCKLYANGKEGRMALGGYPAVGLADARKARDAAKLQKSDGIDPVQARKVEKLKAITPSGDTFKATALEWYAMKLDGWSTHYAIRESATFKKDLFPYFAARRIGEIEAIELLAVIRLVEERGAPGTDHGRAGLALRSGDGKGEARCDPGHSRSIDAAPGKVDPRFETAV